LNIIYLPKDAEGDTRIEVNALHIMRPPYIGKSLNDRIKSFVVLRVFMFQLTVVPVRGWPTIVRNIGLF
jgi:hypothetical protein